MLPANKITELGAPRLKGLSEAAFHPTTLQCPKHQQEKEKKPEVEHGISLTICPEEKLALVSIPAPTTALEGHIACKHEMRANCQEQAKAAQGKSVFSVHCVMGLRVQSWRPLGHRGCPFTQAGTVRARHLNFQPWAWLPIATVVFFSSEHS